MKPKGSVPCSQQPATRPNPEWDQSSTRAHIQFKIQFNTILSSTPVSSKWSLSFEFPCRNSICGPLLPRTCRMSRPSHPLWLDHPNNNSSRPQIMKLLILQSSPVPCYLSLLEQSIFHNTQFSTPSAYVFLMWQPKFTPLKQGKKLLVHLLRAKYN